VRIDFLRLDHLQLCIPIGVEKEARTFYCEVLGMKEVPKPESLQGRGGFWLKAGEVDVHIGVEEGAGANPSKRHPAFEVRNLDAVREHLQKCGVAIREDIPIPGVVRFSIFDPFGNRIELLERL
jgi:catechol 2,3-dioxygenase-like lactoylglutathione lyase family enzyme